MALCCASGSISDAMPDVRRAWLIGARAAWIEDTRLSKPKRRFRQTQLSAELTGKPDRAIGVTDLRRLRVSLTRESCVLAAVLAAVLVAVLAAVLAAVLSLALPLYCFSAFLSHRSQLSVVVLPL